MEVKVKHKELGWPRLGVVTFGDPLPVNIKSDDLLIVSRVGHGMGYKYYVQYFTGSNLPYTTEDMKNIKWLPPGSKVTLTQE